MDAGSVRSDACGLDNLAPLFSFLRDEFAEIRGCAPNRSASEVSNTCPHPGVGQACVDLLVEPVDDLGSRVFGYADAGPRGHLVARYEIAYGRNTRQCVSTCRGCHAQSSQ